MIIDDENGGKESGGGEVRGRKWKKMEKLASL